MRFRSDLTEISYAGAVVLGVGQYFGQDELSRSREYTTQAVQILGADAPLLDSYGNATGRMEFSVVQDFLTPEEAMAEAMARQAHTDAHQTGELVVRVGGAEQTWMAGVQRMEARVSFPGRGVRLTCSYAFVTV